MFDFKVNSSTALMIVLGQDEITSSITFKIGFLQLKPCAQATRTVTFSKQISSIRGFCKKKREVVMLQPALTTMSKQFLKKNRPRFQEPRNKLRRRTGASNEGETSEDKERELQNQKKCMHLSLIWGTKI